MSGFPSLGALQGQWPARAAAPRSSKLNSVTRAGQQHSTPTRDALTCAVTPTVTCPTTMHYYYYTATIRTFKLGDGWGGGCQNWPHLNSSSGTSLLPRSILPRRSSQCPPSVWRPQRAAYHHWSPARGDLNVPSRTFHNLPIA